MATILCHHSIGPADTPHASSTPGGFARQLDWLTEHTHVVPLAAVAGTPADLPRGRPVVALTFDDGYEDGHRHALPALADRGVTATFFISSGFVDDVGDTRDRLADAWDWSGPDLRPLSWGQARELVAAGMEIGGHTRTHRNLADLDPTDLGREIGDDRDRLEQQLAVSVSSFAYPFGRPGRHVTAATVEATRAAGYDRAVTVSFQRVLPTTSRGALPRIPVSHDEPSLLAAKLDGRLDLLGRLQDGRGVPAPDRAA